MLLVAVCHGYSCVFRDQEDMREQFERPDAGPVARLQRPHSQRRVLGYATGHVNNTTLETALHIFSPHHVRPATTAEPPTTNSELCRAATMASWFFSMHFSARCCKSGPAWRISLNSSVKQSSIVILRRPLGRGVCAHHDCSSRETRAWPCAFSAALV